MIQIDNKKHPNLVYLDKNFSDFTPKTLKLRSEVTGKEHTFNGLRDELGLADYFAYFLDLSGCEDGEYVYTLTNGKKQHTGLIHIGKLETRDVEYKAKNENIQYKVDF